MTSLGSMAVVQEASEGSLGLSEVAEQRWRQLTGGKHLFAYVYNPTQRDAHDGGSIAEPLSTSSGSQTPTHAENEDMSASVPDEQESATVSNARPVRSTQTTVAHWARPTQQLLDEMMQNSDGPLPCHFQECAYAPPFVPPEDEEWHVIAGFHVRISRAELDEVLAHAEASGSEDEDLDSLADTSVGFGSVPDTASEWAEDLDEPSAEIAP
eukprot:TRINITY_DN25267_c0_g5_i1.p1 TRINITY_DN25267_c0_g5~~TRINITY_DN25267_c0_g5_i1.p1  ORF type:complete len:211 (-),score=30.88 TRINITY_DN25267_c0_g5_i1:277-909(-)